MTAMLLIVNWQTSLLRSREVDFRIEKLFSRPNEISRLTTKTLFRRTRAYSQRSQNSLAVYHFDLFSYQTIG